MGDCCYSECIRAGPRGKSWSRPPLTVFSLRKGTEHANLAVVFLWLLAVMALLGQRRVEAGTPAPKVYAYCVEIGVPKIKPRSPAELAKLLREIGFDGGGYPILTGPQLDETLQANDAAGLQVYLLQTAINVAPKATARYDAQVPVGHPQAQGAARRGRRHDQRPQAGRPRGN